MTPTSPRTYPSSGTSASSAEAMPCGRLPPEGFVNTSRPCSRRIAVSMLVVVDLPFDPDTNTTPSGSLLTARSRNFGAMASATRPGTAEPPPRRRRSQRARRPATTASRYRTGLLEVVAQRLRAGRVAQLRHRLRLDLADALTRHAERVADLVEGLRHAVAEAEAHADD